MSRIGILAGLLAASLCSMAACTDSIPTSTAGDSLPASTTPGSSNGVVSSINVFLGTTSLNAGSTTKVTYEYVDSNDQVVSTSTVGTPAFSSDNPAVATVSSAGIVTGVGNGTAHIIVTKNNVTGTSPTLTVKGASTAAVASVTVQLNASALTVGQTTQATATQKDASGNVVSATLTWKSSNTAVATVSSSGVVSAVGAGSASITATSSNGVSGSATLSVTATTQVAVASVSVSLASSSLTVGSTTQATATTRDASGAVLTGRSITWSSDNTGIATVSTSGVVTAVAAGTAHIIATSEGKTGSATLTVSAPVTTGSAECSTSHPEWIWCDDFETDRTAKYFEYDNAGGSFTRAAGVGKDGSAGMRINFAAGQVSAGSLKLAFGKVPSSSFKPVDAGTAIYRDVYWRMYVKNQAGWTGGGGDKLSRAMSLAGTNWQQAMIAHVWSGGSSSNWNYLLSEPVSGTDTQGNLLTTQYNDFAHFRWLGSAQSTMPVFDAAHVGQWHCIEAHARLNDAGSSNGVQELFIDGTLQTQRTGLNFVGSYSAYGINAVFFESYWNAGSPVAQSRYFDNIVVSTKPIGC